MLKVQSYLHKHGLESLRTEYSIRTSAHTDGRIILNYDQIESPKYSPIVQECRGLVLDSRDWSLVARSFPRFFNLGEDRASDNKFDWSSCHAMEKVDGSLALVYFHNGQWYVNTRGSFADGEVNGYGFSWRQLFERAAGPNVFEKLDPAYTYVCELCSKYNKVVRHYPEPTVFLLTAFKGPDEAPFSFCLPYYDSGVFSAPVVYQLNSPDAVLALIDQLSPDDQTWEGIVVRDGNGNRLKIKSKSYLRLHRLSNNGNVGNDKALVDIILANELDEVLTYWPELIDTVKELEGKIYGLAEAMDFVYSTIKDIENQKEFALTIQSVPYRGVLFQARKTGVNPSEVFLKMTAEKVLELINARH